ncbi:MAG: PGF-CTERM-anchored ABC transporter substrate-binding protein [Halovenus sp.]
MYRTLVALMVVLAAGPAVAGVAVADGGTAQLDDEVDCEFPVSAEDATGQTVTVEEEPESVVVTAPSAAQHLWSIGAQEKVVGMPVNQFTAYLDGHDERENILGEDGATPDVEQIVALEPDLVIVPNVNDEALVDNLRDAGLTVYYYPLVNDLDSMYELVETVGLLVGQYEDAAAVTAEVAAQVDAVEEAVAEEENPRVYYEFFGFTVGPETLEHDLITRAGGNNIATTGDRATYFELSQEIVAEQDPEWLILQEGNPIPDSEAVQESTAIEQDQIVRVDSNLVSQHGPRNVEPLVRMAEAFHPEAMADIDLDAVEPADASQCAADSDDDTADGADDTTDDTADGTDDTATAEADDDGVGFTAGAALVAVLTLALVARRQH